MAPLVTQQGPWSLPALSACCTNAALLQCIPSPLIACLPTQALFMLADLLVSGVGCEPNEGRAISLLYAAAERGHRMARHYVREYLDADAEQRPAAAVAAAPSSQALARQFATRLPPLPER